MTPAATDARRRLPAMSRLLGDAAITRLASLYGRDPVRIQVERELEILRQRLTSAEPMPDSELEEAIILLPDRINETLRGSLGHGLQRVLNATGILVHTNLGRAPLPREVTGRLPRLLDAYCDVELDLASGKRDDRNRRIEALLVALTGASAALVVNNNAAALVLILATLAREREVIVSRGELVEIGGSFRIPTILEAAGARLVEVGATNRTRLADYESAIGPETGLLLKVFPSNYRLSGFVSSVEVPALVELCKRRGLPLLVDEGSGLLRRRSELELADHLSLAELMAIGCHLACGSGDKLLGGPQAGLLVGDSELVRACQRNPLYRALRPDRACLAALEGVLRMHLVGARMPLDGLWPDGDEHRQRLERLAASIGGDIIPSAAFIGGGAAPERPIEGEAVAVPENDRAMIALRGGDPPVIVFQKSGKLVVDLRTVDPADDETLIQALKKALKRPGPSGEEG